MTVNHLIIFKPIFFSASTKIMTGNLTICLFCVTFLLQFLSTRRDYSARLRSFSLLSVTSVYCCTMQSSLLKVTGNPAGNFRSNVHKQVSRILFSYSHSVRVHNNDKISLREIRNLLLTKILRVRGNNIDTTFFIVITNCPECYFHKYSVL